MACALHWKAVSQLCETKLAGAPTGKAAPLLRSLITLPLTVYT